MKALNFIHISAQKNLFKHGVCRNLAGCRGIPAGTGRPFRGVTVKRTDVLGREEPRLSDDVTRQMAGKRSSRTSKTPSKESWHIIQFIYFQMGLFA